ncbi:MAG: SDR family NAD(P)-dependent oxidoreductase [Acidimicrobiia bacterium]|nr:SDR family NAD(P)-dependent oxidoreductase [Acidimicrobiia bacterium]
MAQVAGAHAIVTGGSSGIGLATARLLVTRGARVSLIARRREQLEAAAADLEATEGSVALATADVADPDALRAAISDLITEMGPCDILVTSAGASRPGHFEQLDDATFRRLMEVNYFRDAPRDPGGGAVDGGARKRERRRGVLCGGPDRRVRLHRLRTDEVRCAGPARIPAR